MVSRMTKTEYDTVIRNANFTADQLRIFEQLNLDEYYDFAIIEKMHMSTRKYYDTKSTVIDKVERISRENGFYEAITKKK